MTVRLLAMPVACRSPSADRWSPVYGV